jgi:hypothetical protein
MFPKIAAGIEVVKLPRKEAEEVPKRGEIEMDQEGGNSWAMIARWEFK